MIHTVQDRVKFIYLFIYVFMYLLVYLLFTVKSKQKYGGES